MRTSPLALDPVETVEDLGQLVLIDARPRIPHCELNVVSDLPKCDRDLSFESELESVRNQVQDDLLPHLSIHEDVLRQRRTVHHHSHTCALNRRAESTA